MAMDGQQMMEAVQGLGWIAGGFALGLIYFRMVRHSADLMLSGKRGGPWIGLALVLLRMAGLGGILFVAAMQGAMPLLLASLGLLMGRYVLMRGQVI